MNTLKRILVAELTPRRAGPKNGEFWKVVKPFSTENGDWTSGEIIKVTGGSPVVGIPGMIGIRQTTHIRDYHDFPLKHFSNGNLKKANIK